MGAQDTRLKSGLLVKLLAERISFLQGGHTSEMLCRAPGSRFATKKREPPLENGATTEKTQRQRDTNSLTHNLRTLNAAISEAISSPKLFEKRANKFPICALARLNQAGVP